MSVALCFGFGFGFCLCLCSIAIVDDEGLLNYYNEGEWNAHYNYIILFIHRYI